MNIFGFFLWPVPAPFPPKNPRAPVPVALRCCAPDAPGLCSREPVSLCPPLPLCAYVSIPLCPWFSLLSCSNAPASVCAPTPIRMYPVPMWLCTFVHRILCVRYPCASKNPCTPVPINPIVFLRLYPVHLRFYSAVACAHVLLSPYACDSAPLSLLYMCFSVLSFSGPVFMYPLCPVHM